LKSTDHINLGFAFHNIGKNTRLEYQYYEPAVGIAYHNNLLVLAGEVDNLNGSDTGNGTNFREGVRLNFQPIRVHFINETSDWGYQSQTAGIEMQFDTLNAGLVYLRIKNKNFGNEVGIIKASLGYKF
jgi:hypothetical protein